MQEYIPFFQAEKRSIAEKLAKYFEYSGLETKIHFDEEKDAYILSVPSTKEREAKKYYQAFYFVERDRIEKEEMNQEDLEEYNESNILSDTSDAEAFSDMATEEIASANMDDVSSDTISDTDDDIDDDQAPLLDKDDDVETPLQDDNDGASMQDDANPEDILTDDEEALSESTDIPNDIDEDQKASVKSLLSGSGSYVMKEEKYKDYVSTQYIFLLMGVAGIVFVILNVMEVLTLLYGIFPNLIMGAFFIFFIYVGISTGKKAKLLKLEIDEETRLRDRINEWLRNTVTDEFLASITNSELSEELDYIKKTDTIREMLLNEFGEQNSDFLDRLIEEFYTDTFD
ncbi:MAG: hypothetical protein EWM47_11405 [Anaerolineaceae bacterium]|nr:MAG: hypothetical protein EWM47_11405 [Anaerolineaceae bacterium]